MRCKIFLSCFCSEIFAQLFDTLMTDVLLCCEGNSVVRRWVSLTVNIVLSFL